jgi:hypothetical protein
VFADKANAPLPLVMMPSAILISETARFPSKTNTPIMIQLFPPKNFNVRALSQH